MNRSQPAQSARVDWLEVSENQEGQRIDNFLLRHLKGVPRSHVYRVLRKGEVRVNKRRIKPDYRLQAGDLVRIPPVRVAEAKPGHLPADPVLERIVNTVVYEDDTLLILDKPSGIAVHGGSGLAFGVIEALRRLRPEARFLELVHRLDRDTSGCLMVAKKRSALRALHEALRAGAVEKRYLALVQGAWSGPRRIDLPLKKNVLRSGERLVHVADNGKAAVSEIEQLELFPRPPASLVRVLLKTGRTHQIRVHTAHLGHPVAGDEKYGDQGFNRAMRDCGLRRLFLHAESLRLRHPLTAEPLEVKAPLARELEKVLVELTGLK